MVAHNEKIRVELYGQELNGESFGICKSDMLVTGHNPEQIAAAFLRAHASGQSAPEELIDPDVRAPKKNRREDFTDGVWFSISVGRNDNAEPRWLLPMKRGWSTLLTGFAKGLRSAVSKSGGFSRRRNLWDCR